MKLTFEKIAYKNIMSVGAKSVEIDLLSNKKILITGKNGGGKSTLLEALCFALFGKPFRSIKKGQLVNSINKKAMLVELWFNDGKNKYYIKRGIKPNVFEIKRNGDEVAEAASVKDFQSMFETEIIKMNMQSFKQTIILGTAGYTPFMELTAGNRRALIEDLINLSIYSKMDKLNKEVVKEIKQQMEALEIKLSGMRNEYDAHMTHIEKQKSMSEDFINQLRVSYDEHVDKAKTINDTIHQLNEKLIQTTTGDLVDNTENIQKCIKVIAACNARIEAITKDMSFFDKDNCPTCKQSISASHRDVIKNKLNTEKEEFDSKMEKANEAYNKYNALQTEFSLINIQIQQIKSEIHNHKFNLTNEVASAKAAKKKIEEAESKVDIDMTRVNTLDAEIKEMRHDKTDLFEEMYARKIVLNMLKDSGIKAVVMKRYIPIINKKINQYLQMLGADYTFTLDQEFNEIIKSRGREDFSYMSFSQGEKARIDLSLLFTWRDIAAIVSGTEISLLILDEVADGATDGEGVHAIHTILDNMKNTTKVVISHREEHDKNLFNKHIRMVKKGRFSVME